MTRLGTQVESPAQRLTPYVEVSKNTAFVNCWNEPFGSRLSRGPILVSPDGRYRVYAEVEATAFKPVHPEHYTGPLCANTSKLFVSGPGGTSFRLVFLQVPERWQLGNSLRVVDWSPDSTHVSVELVLFQYESEGVAHEVLLYSPHFGVFTKPNLEQIVAKEFGKDCAVETAVGGFAAEGNVVLEIGPLEEDVEAQGVKSCVQKKSLWLLDLRTGLEDRVHPLPNGYKIRRYGKFQGNYSSK